MSFFKGPVTYMSPFQVQIWPKISDIYLSNSLGSQVFFHMLPPRSDAPLPRMAQKPICGLGQKWPNPAFFAISAAVAQVVHALWPKRFIWSQVTQ